MTNVQFCVPCLALAILVTLAHQGQASTIARSLDSNVYGSMGDSSRSDHSRELDVDSDTEVIADIDSDFVFKDISQAAEDSNDSMSSSSSRESSMIGSRQNSLSSSIREKRSSSKEAVKEKKSESSRLRIGPNAAPVTSLDTDSSMAESFLSKYGYFRQGKPLNLHLAPTSGDGTTDSTRPTRSPHSEAIRMFQSYFGLKQTGELDENTVNLMKRDRCGVADIPQEVKDAGSQMNEDDQTPAEFSLLGEKWDRNTLTWHLEIPTNQLHREIQRKAIVEAFNVWRNVAPLDFQELSARPRTMEEIDINIQFGSREHGDGYPFDGHGLVLAHAFGPGGGAIAGDMHIDNDEKWGVNNEEDKNDLYLVAVHELGHSLGLSHSRDPDAIMYPYYGLTDRLGQDDIKAIQSLYGVRIGQYSTARPRVTTPRTGAPPTRQPPQTGRPTGFPYTKSPTYTDRPSTPAPDDCLLQFDHVIQDDAKQMNVYTGIQGEQVFRFNAQGVLGGYPSSLQLLYPGAPSMADSVFTIPEKSATYFLKGNRVWKYLQYQMASGFPKDLDPQHFQETVRFVLPLVDTNGHRRIFVFGTTLWLEYNFDQPYTTRPRHHVIPQYWPGVANDVNYAVTGTDNYIYLISPDSHVILDSFRRPVQGGKKMGHPDWMKPACVMAAASYSGAGSRLFASTATLVLPTVLSLVLYLLQK